MLENRRQSDPNILELVRAVAELHSDFKGFRAELLGDGQPGRIQRMESDISTNKQAIASTDSKIKYYAGIATGISIVVGFLRSLVWRH